METTIVKKAFHLSTRIKEILFFSICLACIFLFLSSAYSKIVDHETFLQGLSKVSLIGSYAQLIGWLVPFVEITISLLLIVPKTQKKGLYGFIGIMIAFTFYILCMLLWADKLPCHCNLIINSFTWGQHIWFNLAFIGLAGFALRLNKTNIKS